MPELDPIPLDDTAARAAALDTRSSCVVEAPAGSGKTGLLMQRYLKLLLEDSVAQPEEILAITFTRKAAAELRDRVLIQLERAHLRKPLAAEASAFDGQTRALALAVLTRDAQLGWSVLERPHRLNLRTIDSVSAEIASSLPLLSFGGAGREPTEDATPLHRLAARRTLFQLGGSNAALHQALRTLLLHRDGSLADCETLLAQMLAAREQWGELIPLGPSALDDATLDREVRPRLERALEAIVCNGLTHAANAMPAGFLAELTTLAARLGLEPGYNGKPSPIAFCASRNTPPEAIAAHLEHWVALIALLLKPSDHNWRAGFARNHIGFEIQKPDAAYLKQLVDSVQTEPLREALRSVRLLPPAAYPDEQWQVAKALFHVLNHALAELKVLFAERGECDFTELALAAREALHADSTAPDIALAFGGKLRHLLVDEMQDTSSAQYELIDLLTRSWDGHTQTLFLVGDPKQSIYLFRQARVERFLRTMRERRLGDIVLQPLRLTANFRSQSTLVEAFNGSFSRLFPSPTDLAHAADDTDVPFVAADPRRTATGDNGILWHAAILPEPAPGTNPKRELELQQARDIRSIIEHWLAKPLPSDRTEPWRIAILARGRAHLTAVVSELKRDHSASGGGSGPIPYRAVDIDPLADRPEVLDALALTRALLHPADRVAWLAVLHAPWCGLGLSDLLTLTGDSNTADRTATIPQLLEAHAHRLSAEGQELLARAWPVLAAAIAGVGRTSLDVHVERTWRSLGGDATLQPEQRRNVLRFLAILRELTSEGGRIELSTLDFRLVKLYAESAAGNPSVELLTIHKAKGLEWDVVLVPSLERNAPRRSSDLLNWLELDSSVTGASVVLAPIYGKGSDSDKLNNWIRHIHSAREASERKRLFYVASTRAREELHLFASARRKQNGELCAPDSTSLLKAAWPAAEPFFANLPTPSSDTPELALSDDLLADLARSLDPIGDPYNGLTLIASADEESIASAEPPPPLLERLPLHFDPRARFATAATHRLPYLSAATLPQAPAFDRPEGSFSVRAFGNVVHRFLQVLANHLVTTPAAALLAELPTWEPRLAASLRGEGLPPALATREAPRALAALTRSLADPTGLWILSPHPQAASERSLTLAPVEARSIRADRTFAAGPTPLSSGDSAIWIIDFKTGEQGSRSNADFEAAELDKYRAQLESYALVRRSLPGGDAPLHLGLFYPLIPRLIHWPAQP